MERALGERGERPHLLDLVAEELDAQRLSPGAREDIDDPSSNGDLPALVGTLAPLVPGEGKRFDELLEGESDPRGESQRHRARRRRRDPFGECEC